MKAFILLAVLFAAVSGDVHAREITRKVTHFSLSESGDLVVFHGKTKRTVSVKDVRSFGHDDEEDPCDDDGGEASVCQGARFGQPVWADDRRTIGWLVGYKAFDGCSPVLAVYRGGKVVDRIETGSFIRNWVFLEEGARIAFSEGPCRGDVRRYVLYDVENANEIESYPDPDADFDAQMPAWAKGLGK